MHIAGAVDTEGAGEEQRRNTATQTSKYKRHWAIDSIIHFAERAYHHRPFSLCEMNSATERKIRTLVHETSAKKVQRGERRKQF